MKTNLKDYKELRKMLSEEIRLSRNLENKVGAFHPSVTQLQVHIVEGYIILHQMEDAMKTRIKTKRRLTPEESLDKLVKAGCNRDTLLRLVDNVRKASK